MGSGRVEEDLMTFFDMADIRILMRGEYTNADDECGSGQKL